MAVEPSRATMQDVATRAGVSLSTVSFALNNTRPVADKTRARIEAAMTELGYRRNMLARGLASRHSRMLTLAFPVTSRGVGATAMEFVESAASGARELGYQLAMLPLQGVDDGAVVDAYQHGICDGALLMEVYQADPRVPALTAVGCPFVLIGRTESAASLDYVDIDFDAAAGQALDRLVADGHRAVGFISHSQASFDAGYGPTVRMHAALPQAAAARGVSLTAVFSDDNAAAGRSAVAALVDGPHPPTALVVMNDDAVFGVLAELARRGLHVPSDISVLSIASSPAVGEKAWPTLTALNSPGADLGRLGVEALIAKLEGQAPSTPVLLACSLHEGASVGPAPQHTKTGRKAP